MAEEDNPSSSDSSSSDSSSDEDDVEMDQEDEALRKKLETLNEQIRDQPTSYDLLVEKIQILQNMGELKELRNARTTLSKLYPLTPELWLSWIQDESTLVTDEKGKRDIIDLFELAVKDYQSVRVWLQYIKYLRDMGPDCVIECRVVCERALAAMGLHVQEGSQLWDAYREFECELLSADGTNVDQKMRYKSLCLRQLSVPLVGMDKTFENVKEAFEIDEATEKSYKNALERLELLKIREQELTESSNSAAAYKSYIEIEKQALTNPAKIVCLFERGICQNPLDSTFWMEYLNYASNELKIGSSVLEILERASRNCPWDILIWIQWMHEIEKFADDSEDIQDKVRAVFERGLEYCTTGDQTGNLWLKYIQFLRRRISLNNPTETDVQLFMRTLTTAEEHLNQIIPEPREYIGEILLFGIRLQAHISKAMVKSRKLWYQALHKGYGQQFKLWIQFFQLEQRYGETSSTRKCLEKAMSVMTDGLDIVAELWLNFERDFGDLKSMKHAEDKISEFLGKKYAADLEATKAGKNKPFQKGKGKRQWKDNPNQHEDQHDGPKNPKNRKFNKPRAPKTSEGQDGSTDQPSSSAASNSHERPPPFEKKTQRRPPKSFVPRSLQIQQNTSAKSQQSPIEATVSVSAASTSDSSEFKKPMSNADFRNLFKKPL